MKIWPFDDFGIAQPGPVDHARRARRGARAGATDPRAAVGSRMRIMIEGHGFWRLPAAVRIARALEQYDIEWLEDMLLAHDIGALAELKAADDHPDPRERVPGDPPPVPAAARAARGRHRHARPDLDRRDHRIAQDRVARRHVRAAGHDARLHRAVHAAGRRPPRARRPERDLPGDGPGLHPDLVPRRRAAQRRRSRTASSCRRPSPGSGRASCPTSRTAPMRR